MTSITDTPENLFNPKNGEKQLQDIEQVTIRFVGDSGDGMQLTGSRFTSTTAVFGNDLATYPDYPAEIRAPAGTTAGVSGFQVHFSSLDVHTPGDQPEVLVAMNPAALKANIKDLIDHGVLVVNEDAFTDDNLQKAGYASNPLTDGSLQNYRVIPVPISRATVESLSEVNVNDKEKDRSKNMFALGLVFWMFDRELESTEKWIAGKFKSKPDIMEANIAALKAGYNFAITSELLPVHFQVRKAKLAPGIYRNVTGNEALALGVITVAQVSGEQVFMGAYPITPASDILHYLAKYTHYGIRVFQAEDEIAAISAAIGSSYAGSLGLTATSGPGLALKSEALGLAVMAELPLVIVDVQRGGPSTGLPTKVEQSDLLQALYGRSGESPLCVMAPHTSVDCYHKIMEAFRIAVTHMTPVILLSDSYLANGSEAWKLPTKEELPEFKIKYQTSKDGFQPYSRDPKTLARPWVKPGTPDLEHRIGGLEKQDITGAVSYDPANHNKMVLTRAEKIKRIADDIPEAEIIGEGEADILLIGWGSTYGSIYEARKRLVKNGIKVHQVHIDYINPFPKNLGTILEKYKTRICIEMNLGQLAFQLQGVFGIQVDKINKVSGQPFYVTEIVDEVTKKV